MINLSSEPSLSSLTLTRGGFLKYSYVLPNGMTFPADAVGTIVFTDRAGGVYDGSPFVGELNEKLTEVSWLIDSDILDSIPTGANFEVFVAYDDATYKVRYGRVARKEAEFPLSPLAAIAPPLMYEDTLQRNQVGPRWIAKVGRVAMNQPAGTPEYAMSARNNIALPGGGVALFAQAACLWYAPTQGDSIEMTVGLCDGGDGTTTIVLCSNYAMTSFIGVRFLDANLFNGPDRIEIVTGSAWNNLTVQGGSYSHIVADNGSYYTIKYSSTLNKVSVFVGGSTTPAIEWTDTSGVMPHGAGYRYQGAIWYADLVNTGPQLYYWKVKDAV